MTLEDMPVNCTEIILKGDAVTVLPSLTEKVSKIHF
jgi:hypothetical protein